MSLTNLIEFRKRNCIFLALLPEQLLTIAAYGEARGEGEEGMKGVINVMNNRTKIGGWFKDIDNLKEYSLYHQVILRAFQFSCFNMNDPNRKSLEEIAFNFSESLGIYNPLPIAYNLSVQCVEGHLEDNTVGATFYHNKHMDPYPSWAKKFVKTVEIKNHVFYKQS